MSECPCKPILNIIPKCDPALNIQPECPVTLNVVETQRGAPGKDATINGVNALEIRATDGITGTTEGKTFIISGQELQGDIIAENNRAIEAEEALDNKIDSEADTRADEITRVEGLISDEETRARGVETSLQANITAEENRAKGVEQQLSSSIDSNHQAISNHVSDKNNPHEVTKAQVGLGNVENLAPADMPLSTATKTYVDNADTVLQGQINTINTTIGGYGNIVTHNVSEFATASQGALADTALQPNDNISELTNNLNYQTAIQVANSIAVETSNRELADNGLQSQIDAIVSASDVFDIVGTYAELQAYDITTVPVNDIIKVLVDETHSGAATYYRCVETGGVKSWSYIGSEGAYYTKGEADSKFVPQTRTVNSKALSSDITLTASDVGALPDSTVIPTVNDATVTIQKNGSTVSTFTLNQSSNETVDITVPTDTNDLTNGAGFITSADLPTNYVTTDTAQNIDSVKTFLGEKAILFKQKAATNKLGFTLYDTSNSELGALEYRPNTINGNPLLNLNCSQAGNVWLGFRYWSNINIIAPKPSNGNYYIPVNFTDGNTTVTANNAGTVNLSSILPSAPTYTAGTGIDITSNTISVTAPTLKNESSWSTCLAIGEYSGAAPSHATAVGSDSSASADYAVVLGSQAYASADYAIQLGSGTNSTARSLSVGFGLSYQYQLLDGTTGLIPDARISSNIARTSAIPTVDQTYDGTSANPQSGVAIAGAGFITGITSGDVTTALGYTPVDPSDLANVATSGAYSDLSGKPNYGAGLSYSSSSLQLLDQNGNNLGSAVTIKSTPDLDGVTIDTNSSDELEAIGTVNQNTASGATAVKYDWIGTLAEYNSQNVETLHPDWICYITDDVSGGTSVYTKTEVDNAISTALTAMLDSAFPVGSRYITEASTCPLATLIPNSTWVLTSQGRVLQGADSNHASGTTAEAGLPNITGSFKVAGPNGGIDTQDGAFYKGDSTNTQFINSTMSTNSGVSKGYFDASRSNSIYGNSTTVQPPAEFVNIFKRTA